MKRNLLRIFAPATAMALLLAGCGGEEEPETVVVDSYEEYSLAPHELTMNYPGGWVKQETMGNHALFGDVLFYSSDRIVEGFSYLEPKGNTGARIVAYTNDGDQQHVSELTATLRETFANGSGPESVTVNGRQASKITYDATLQNGQKLSGERYYFVNDSVVSYVDVSVIGEMSTYRSVFDSVLASVTPGHAIARADSPGGDDDTSGAAPQPAEVPAPSSTMTTLSRPNFSISHPDNFDVTSTSNGVQLVGPDGSSSTAISVQPAQNMTLDQVATQYTKQLSLSGGSNTTVGGSPGKRYNYSPRGFNGAAYLTVANNKVYLVMQTWLPDHAEQYRPVFQKMISSFRAK